MQIHLLYSNVQLELPVECNRVQQQATIAVVELWACQKFVLKNAKLNRIIKFIKCWNFSSSSYSSYGTAMYIHYDDA